MGEERKMKDSGIEWIGEIPEEWEVKRLKNIGFTKSGLGNKKPEDFGYGYPFITYKNIYSNYYISEDYPDLINSTDIERINYNILRGDVFFTGSSETIEELGLSSVCLKNIKGATYNGFCIRFRPYSFDKYYPEYMMYCFRSNVARGFLIQNDNSVTRSNLSQKLLKSMPVIIPSLNEQQKIANFLDRKVGEIDRIIEKTRESIEDYKKYKQSLITETVTKGLDKNAKMKDSGIEWIGEIPEEWDVAKLKYLFVIKKDIAGTIGYDILSVTQSGLKIKDISKNEGQLSNDYSKYQIVNINDFVMNHMDLLTGWVDCSIYKGVTSPDYRVFRIVNEVGASNDYFKYIFQICYLNKIFYGLGQGVSNLGRWRLQTDKFINFTLPVPILEEQNKIVSYIDRKVQEIRIIINQKNNLITQLETYKKSLIYEAVTGKKEV